MNNKKKRSEVILVDTHKHMHTHKHSHFTSVNKIP